MDSRWSRHRSRRWSIYWAFGGGLLLETVGQWAVEAVEECPRDALMILLGVSLVKLAGAWVPILAQRGTLPWLHIWRILGWIGGPFLILYGGADTVAGSAVLLGLFDVDDTDQAGLVGHAFIWGPLFALWGMALTLGLFLTRKTHPALPGQR